VALADSGCRGEALEDHVGHGGGLVRPRNLPVQEFVKRYHVRELQLGGVPEVVHDFSALEAEPGGVGFEGTALF